MSAIAEDPSRPAEPAARRAGQMSGYGLAGPAFLLMLLLLIGPAAAVFVIACTSWEFGARTIAFVGLSNFVELTRDPIFLLSLRNTALYALAVVPFSGGLGLVLAVLIDRAGRLGAFYRTVHFLPYMATLAAMAMAWEALLHPTVGLLNAMMEAAGLAPRNWLRDEQTVLGALAMIGVWQNTGVAMVLFAAGLKSVPQELYDAATVDGADGGLDRLRTVTLPMLGPVSLFVFITLSVRALETFDTVRILTQGGPAGASEVLLHTLFTEAFTYLRTGYGAAITVVFLSIIAGLTLLQARLADRRTYSA